jgi:hypothetical protein
MPQSSTRIERCADKMNWRHRLHHAIAKNGVLAVGVGLEAAVVSAATCVIITTNAIAMAADGCVLPILDDHTCLPVLVPLRPYHSSAQRQRKDTLPPSKQLQKRSNLHSCILLPYGGWPSF